jgi:acetolactate synthase-1/2/3 large subunit
MIKQAKKPVLLIGQWIKNAGAEYELQNFVNSLNIPTVSTIFWKWVLREDNENYLGMLWMHWFYHANIAISNADLIISVGSRFDDRIVWTYDDFAKNAKVIHIDIDKSELWKVVKTDLAIHADAKDFLTIAWYEELTSLDIQLWREQINTWREEHPFQEKTNEFSTKNALNSINKITETNLDKYIFVTDVWQHQMWAAQILKVANTKSWLTSGWAW